jgi:cold shock CspA family protein
MPTGRVVTFHSEKCYGFIAPDDGGRFHESATTEDGLVAEGMSVSFEIGMDAKSGKEKPPALIRSVGEVARPRQERPATATIIRPTTAWLRRPGAILGFLIVLVSGSYSYANPVRKFESHEVEAELGIAVFSKDILIADFPVAINSLGAFGCQRFFNLFGAEKPIHIGVEQYVPPRSNCHDAILGRRCEIEFWWEGMIQDARYGFNLGNSSRCLPRIEGFKMVGSLSLPDLGCEIDCIHNHVSPQLAFGGFLGAFYKVTGGCPEQDGCGAKDDGENCYNRFTVRVNELTRASTSEIKKAEELGDTFWRGILACLMLGLLYAGLKRC